jgi:hypothetical protein
MAIGLALLGAVLFANGVVVAVTGPNPSGPVAVSVTSPTSSLNDGAAVTYDVTSSGGATITSVTTHICATGAGISNSADFGYQGTFCVKQAGIALGGLNGADYATVGTFASVTDTGTLTFHAGSGSVTWIDDLSGVHTLVCDASDPCDLVIQVQYNLAPQTSYFAQTLTFASSGTTTTTSPTSTTGGATTTTHAATTTTSASTTTTHAATTTTAAATTTTHAATTTTAAATTTSQGATTTTDSDTSSTTTTFAAATGATTTLPSTGVTVFGTGATGGGTGGTGSSLAFTGANTRDVLSGSLLLMAAGLLLLAQYIRRQAHA